MCTFGIGAACVSLIGPGTRTFIQIIPISSEDRHLFDPRPNSSFMRKKTCHYSGTCTCKSQEEACESLKDPIDGIVLAIDVLF
jgi:hypothetical protein